MFFHSFHLWSCFIGLIIFAKWNGKFLSIDNFAIKSTPGQEIAVSIIKWAKWDLDFGLNLGEHELSGSIDLSISHYLCSVHRG